MKQFDIVKLINDKPYKEYTLQKNMHGIIIKISQNFAQVLFFNPKNMGEYIILQINRQDLIISSEKLPQQIKDEFPSKLSTILKNAKKYFKPLKVKAYETVELLVENEKYAKFGIHKGDTGCVMEDNAINNQILVDFSGIDENGDYYGDCILVNLDDVASKS